MARHALAGSSAAGTSSPSSATSAKVLLYTAIGIPAVWYSYLTTYTWFHLRRRERLYRQRLAGDVSVYETLSQAIHARFAVLRDRLTGRFLNVTKEFREQGVHEFLIHQWIWRPLTGRIWWNGGLSNDPAVRAESLPNEKPDFDRLLKNSQRLRSSRKGKGKESPVSETGSSEDDWEKLEHSRIQQSATKEAYEMTYTWFGQSTSLVQIDGATLLTDPVFGDKPVDSWIAPSRMRPTPCSLSELISLNVVDVVVISHDHYDHLDVQVVEALQDRVAWVVPLGLKKFLVKHGVSESRITEMTWWQEEQLQLPNLAPLRIACTPTQHWSGRTPLDTNQSLWCGFIVKSVSSSKSFFHAGDTGYSKDLYEAIGQVHGGITLAAIPIGSYDPRWIMNVVHTDPEGAVRIHQQLLVEKSIAVHHSTWTMSDERYDDPARELARQLGRLGVSEDDFVVLPTGRTVVV